MQSTTLDSRPIKIDENKMSESCSYLLPIIVCYEGAHLVLNLQIQGQQSILGGQNQSKSATDIPKGQHDTWPKKPTLQSKVLANLVSHIGLALFQTKHICCCSIINANNSPAADLVTIRLTNYPQFFVLQWHNVGHKQNLSLTFYL